jgi:transglutaminase-like putative cysteine protease
MAAGVSDFGVVRAVFGWVWLVLAAAVLAPVAGFAAASDDAVGNGPPAPWVHELPIPKARPSRMREVEDGVYYLLSDTQVKPEHDSETFFRRNVYLVTDRSGLEEAARLDVDFDPSFEHIVLHRVHVIRVGQVLDRLPSANIRVMERESGLDNGVFDGLKTVHVEIKDVEVGDVVDLEYSWEQRASFWPGEFFGSVTIDWSVPEEETHYRLLWPANRALTIRNRNTKLAPAKMREGDDISYEWTAIDATPIRGEDGTPDWYPTWGTVELSSMMSWAQVVNWALPLYAIQGDLPPELAARVDAIAKKYPKPEDRITMAMRLVEDELRYVSISIGTQSFTPRSPAEVFRSGYGDCKDKSELLVAMLRRLGVEAYVALTDTKNGPALPQMAPAANIYDHAIVEVRLRGRNTWIDPTSAHAGGRFPDLAPVDYGYGLPIAPGQTHLDRMTPIFPKAPTYRTEERYTLSGAVHPSLTLSVQSTYAGADADSMRSSVASKSLAKLESDYLDFYRGLYPGIARDKPLRVVDDRETNRLTTYESYRLSADSLRRDKLLGRFPVKASSLDTYDKVPAGERKTPYQLATAVNKEHVVVVVTPGHAPPAPKAVDIDGPAFRYTLDTRRDGDTLTLDYHLVGKADAVMKAGDVPGVADDAQSVTDDNYWYLDLNSKAGGTMGETSASAWWRTFLLTLAGIAVAALLAGAAVFAVRIGLLVDDGYARDGVFYPVSVGKFLLMSLVTAGLYAVFWMWKCWRWQRFHGTDQNVAPVWRALFAVIWLHLLFEDVNLRGRFGRGLRVAAGICAILFVVWEIVLLGLGAAHFVGTMAVMQALSFIFVLPVVIAVNRLNAERPEILRANSRMTDLSGLAVAGGLLAWIALLAPAILLGPGKDLLG